MMKRLGFALLLVTACGGSEEDFTAVKLDENNPNKTLQFETPIFEVASGEEVQDCYFFNMPDLNNGQDYWIDRVRLGSNPGSHHLNIFRVKTIVNLGREEDGNFVHNGECFKSANWSDWPLIANNQESDPENGYFDWQLPAGVAYKFSPGERIMVQTHFVNASTQKTPFKGKAVVDFYKSSMTAPMELGTLFATQQSIRICKSNPNVEFHGTCRFTAGDVTIAAANGHFHSRGVKFDIFKWDGVSPNDPPLADRFYQSDTWDDPPMTIYNNAQGMQVANGGGVWWSCAYEWQQPLDEVGGCAALDAADVRNPGAPKDCCYTFGPKVETSEHCNAFVYYYPKRGDSDVNCF